MPLTTPYHRKTRAGVGAVIIPIQEVLHLIPGRAQAELSSTGHNHCATIPAGHLSITSPFPWSPASPSICLGSFWYRKATDMRNKTCHEGPRKPSCSSGHLCQDMHPSKALFTIVERPRRCPQQELKRPQQVNGRQAPIQAGGGAGQDGVWFKSLTGSHYLVLYRCASRLFFYFITLNRFFKKSSSK